MGGFVCFVVAVGRKKIKIELISDERSRQVKQGVVLCEECFGRRCGLWKC